MGDPRARRGNRGSGLARAWKESQAVIVGGISLEGAPPTCQDYAETASIIVNGRKGLYEHGHRGARPVAVSSARPAIGRAAPTTLMSTEQRALSEPTTTEKSPERRQPEEPNVALTQGQINAVRATFKAGITPSRIARQFGISQSDVRKVLASEHRRSGKGR